MNVTKLILIKVIRLNEIKNFIQVFSKFWWNAGARAIAMYRRNDETKFQVEV
jgi:hypothetical protein